LASNAEPGGGAGVPIATRRAGSGAEGSRPRTVRARKCRKGEFRRPPTHLALRRGVLASLGKAPPPGAAPGGTGLGDGAVFGNITGPSAV
jgi:hypothetical protein